MWPTVNGLLRDRQQLLQTFHDVYFTGNSETGQMRSLWLCQAIRGSGRGRDSQMRSLWLCQAIRGRGKRQGYPYSPSPTLTLRLCQIDPRIALVLMFAERKRAKDSSP